MSLFISLPAVLASGAHQMGEESLFIVSRAARALDVRGSSRAPLAALEAVCAPIFSPKQYGRLLADVRLARYAEREERDLRLRSEASVLRSFATECEVLPSRASCSFHLALLNTRQRRGAALLAAMLSGSTSPRSYAYINRFARVDRGTISGWMKDPVIRDQILAAHHEFALGERRRIQLPNSWQVASEPSRGSFLLGKALRSLHVDEGTKPLRQRYYDSDADLLKVMRRRRMLGADIGAELAALGSVYVRLAVGWHQRTAENALALEDISPLSLTLPLPTVRDPVRAAPPREGPKMTNEGVSERSARINQKPCLECGQPATFEMSWDMDLPVLPFCSTNCRPGVGVRDDASAPGEVEEETPLTEPTPIRQHLASTPIEQPTSCDFCGGSVEASEPLVTLTLARHISGGGPDADISERLALCAACAGPTTEYGLPFLASVELPPFARDAPRSPAITQDEVTAWLWSAAYGLTEGWSLFQITNKRGYPAPLA